MPNFDEDKAQVVYYTKGLINLTTIIAYFKNAHIHISILKHVISELLLFLSHYVLLLSNYDIYLSNICSNNIAFIFSKFKTLDKK